MKVVVNSRESIKPLHPTPDHLRYSLLCFLDQINNPNFVPFIYYYSSPSHGFDHFQRSHRLKKSLSEILTSFYPLAGRLRDNIFIDCNDDGAYYVEAETKCQLSELLEDPNKAQINNLLPFHDLQSAGDLLLAIQVTFFDCGGMAIGTLFSHKIADALSMVTFVNCWAAAASGRDHNRILSPKFDLANFFPPRDMVGCQARNTGISKEKFIAKRFVFSASAIAALKAKHPINTVRPSRVEALTAFIWSRFRAATLEDADAGKVAKRRYSVTQGVNLRTRINPKLPEFYFGNLSRFSITQFISSANTSSSISEESCALLTQLRESLKKIDANYVKRLEEGNIKQRFSQGKGLVIPIAFSSVIRFPMYEPDFGWGKPVWVTMAAQPFENLVCFLPTRSGDAVEAWINMKVDDMAKLEADTEFLAFTSPNSGSKSLFHSAL